MAFFYKDTEGRYLGCNEEFSRIVGVAQEMIIGKTVFDLWSRDLAEVYHRQDMELLAQPSHQVYEFKVRKADGQLIDVVFNKDVFRDDRGTIQGIVGTFLDITLRKQAEEKIASMNEELEERVRERTVQLEALNRELSEEISGRMNVEKRLALLNFALNHAHESVHLIDETGRFQYVNDEFCRTIGYSHNELRWMSVPDIDPDIERAGWPGIWEDLKKRGAIQMERRHRSRDGNIFPVEITATYFAYGENGYCIVLGRDITERKAVEEERREYTKRLKSFSSRLVEAREAEQRRLALELHDEIGQTLTGIKLSLLDIKRSVHGTDSDKVDMVQQEIGDLMIRIKDLSTSLRPSLLDNIGLLPALEWHIGRFRDKTGMSVDFRHNGIDRPLYKDLALIVFRIVQESLTNIARHSAADTARITISAHDPDMIITISDNGNGFDADLAIKSSGTLGLIGMKERTENIGGTFRILTSPGSGTEISCIIPLDPRGCLTANGGHDANPDS